MTPRRTLMLASLLCALLASAGHAAADDTHSPKSEQRADLTAYSFEDQLVVGDTLRPDGEVLQVRNRGARESLVRARTHFVPELLKSAADL